MIEAQAVGTPVIARPVPAVRELLTENDVLCESFEVEALYLAMSEFLSSTGSGRETNSSKLLHHLKSFSQSELARSVADIYRDVLAKG